MDTNFFFDDIYKKCEQIRIRKEEKQEKSIIEACFKLMESQKKAGFFYDNSDFFELIINYLDYFNQTDYFYPEEYFQKGTIVKKGLYTPIVDRMLLNKEVLGKIKNYSDTESIIKKQSDLDENKKFLYKLIQYCKLTYENPSKIETVSLRLLKYAKKINVIEADIIAIFNKYKLYREGLLEIDEAFPYKDKNILYSSEKYSLNDIYRYLNIELNDGNLNNISRKKYVINRIKRDSALIADLKIIHNHTCQICGTQIKLGNNIFYSEGHHIKPIGRPHFGPDTSDNILIVCANCHVMCDYGSIKLDVHSLNNMDKHVINREFINYHNTSIFLKN